MPEDQVTASVQRPEPQTVDEDFFASILSLEEQYHAEGYDLGVADGARAGRIEGRQFGLEKGLAKAVEMGRMHGRASVWHARLHISPPSNEDMSVALPITPLSGTERLRKHVERMVELTDPASLETKNSEEAVQEFEERLGGAKAKSTLICKIINEDGTVLHDHQASPTSLEHQPTAMRPALSAEMEDFRSLPTSRGTRS